MGKLDELRQLVADAFAEAADKSEIEKLAKINNAIEEVSKEQDDLVAKNADLIQSYKTLVQHTSFGDKPGENASELDDPKPVSFEDALSQFMNNKK